MADKSSFPHARNHVSPAVDGQGPVILPNAPTSRYGAYAVTENCACAECTGSSSNGSPTWYTTDWVIRPSGDVYTNRSQDVSNPIGASLIAPVPAQMHFTAPGVQEQDNRAHSQAITGTPQSLAAVQPRQDPTIRISVAEGLRRLADRYVNNPGTLVSVVRLEPGPSGGFQVVIMLEMADLP